MKCKKTASALVAFILLVSSLTACNLFGKGGGESSAPSSSVPAAVSSAVDSSSATSLAQSSSVSQAVSSSVTNGAATTGSKTSPQKSGSNTNEQVFPIVTDNKEFNSHFKQNPIDSSYVTNSSKIYSNTDMTQLNEKYAKFWQIEIDSAYKKLLAVADATAKTKFKAEQENWVDTTPTALKKISKDALAAGGSSPQVEASGQIMDYYRNRAAQVYKELYGYNKNYTYEFKG